MKGSATIIGLISGRSAASRQIVGRSSARGQVHGRHGGQVRGSVLPRTCPLAAGSADGLPVASGEAERTRETGLFHWLQVTPTEPQQLVWLNPQMSIDYTIETSTGLHWKII